MDLGRHRSGCTSSSSPPHYDGASPFRQDPGPWDLLIPAKLPEGAPEAQPWNVDASHTEVDFTVKHFFTQVAGFEAQTTIDRRDFEVGVANWAQTVIVGGEVDISIALEANQM